MEAIATVTSRGQVTIPAEIRRHLGLNAADKVAFVVDEAGAVQVRPLRTTWEDLAGSIPPIPGRETVDFEDYIEEVMDAEADRIVRDMGGL